MHVNSFWSACSCWDLRVPGSSQQPGTGPSGSDLPWRGKPEPLQWLSLTTPGSEPGSELGPILCCWEVSSNHDATVLHFNFNNIHPKAESDACLVHIRDRTWSWHQPFRFFESCFKKAKRDATARKWSLQAKLAAKGLCSAHCASRFTAAVPTWECWLAS